MPEHHIDWISGTCPIQAEGTIGGVYRLYFRGRGGRWQFVAGPMELDTDALAEQMLVEQGYLQEVERDERVLVIQGDDEEEGYLDVARAMIDMCIQQFTAWLRSRETSNV